MSTQLERNINAYISKNGGTVVHTGVTAIYDGTKWEREKPTAWRTGRSNLSKYIKSHPDSVWSEDGKWCELPNHTVLFGAKHGGTRGCYAKQITFAVIRDAQ